MSTSMPPFDATIFLENVDYRAIDNGLHLLSKQLERIKGELRDLESLSAGGDNADSADSGTSSNSSKIIPKIPSKDLPILTLPTFPIQNYRRKYTRRSNTKYEQNAEHILAQIEALETGLTFLNPLLPLPPHPLPPLDEGPVEGWKRVVKSYSDTNDFDHDTKPNTDDESGGGSGGGKSSDVGHPLKQPLLTCNTTQSTFQEVLHEKTKIRKEIIEICSAFEGMKSFLKKISGGGVGGGSASQQTTSPTTLTAKHTSTTPPPRPFSAPPVTRRASAAALLQGDFKTEDEDIFVPQRSESTTSLSTSSSTTSTTTKTSSTTKAKMANPTTIRIPSRPQQQSQQNERGANYNLPWTRLEIRQLSELLVHFPEEEVQCRRWAKISAALGTRTPTQVSNRINKMAQKEKKKRSFGAAMAAGTTGGVMMDMASNNNNNNNNTITARSKEELQKEYEGLEKALKVLEENKDPENEKCHYGFRCDCCGIEPIVGRLRYQCLRCRGVDLCSKCHDGSAFARCKDHPFLKNS